MMSRRQFLQWLTAAGVTGAAASAYAFVIEPLLRLQITRYELQPKRWPMGLDLTIAVLADIHAARPWMDAERINAIVDQTNELGADLILLLGDYVAGLLLKTSDVPAAEWARALARLKAPLGVHSILGNHEYWEDLTVQRAGAGITYGQRALEAVGIPVYVNEAVRLVHGGKPFWLAGLGDQVAFLPSRRARPGQPYGVDPVRHVVEGHRRGAHYSTGARARHHGARAGARLVSAERPYAWRTIAVVWLVAGGSLAVRQSIRLWPCARAVRSDRLGRSGLQHHAHALWRTAGDRGGESPRP